jgi:hypothetical protein
MKSPFGILVVLVSLCASSAPAQIARVFLAGGGNDVNDCSNIDTPCGSLQGAVNQCPVKGEVIIISSGGFGNATITKSLTVDAAPGVLAFNARTITVNAGPTDHVTLRGLTMNGKIFGDDNGIAFIAGGTLNVENCDISGFATAGILQAALGALNLRGCAIHDVFDGLFIVPAGAGSATLSVVDSSFRNTSTGIDANASTVASIVSSQFVHNGTAIVAASNSAAATGFVSVDRCTITGSYTTALNANAVLGGIARIYVTNTPIINNYNTMTFTLATGGIGSIVSFGNNPFSNNTITTLFSSTVPTT